MLSREARFGKPVTGRPEPARVLELYDRVRLELAQAILGRWRCDPDYLDAMRVLSKTAPHGAASTGASAPRDSGNSAS